MTEIAMQHAPENPKVDSSVVKVCSEFAPVGPMGQKYLATGIKMCKFPVENSLVASIAEGLNLPTHLHEHAAMRLFDRAPVGKFEAINSAVRWARFTSIDAM